jgi:hypothetical protein
MATVFLPLFITAALRALVVALVVWTGLRLLRVTNVMAQKTAWSLVLAAAFLLPLAPGGLWLPAGIAARLPRLSETWPTLSSHAQRKVVAPHAAPVMPQTAQISTMEPAAQPAVRPRRHATSSADKARVDANTDALVFEAIRAAAQPMTPYPTAISAPAQQPATPVRHTRFSASALFGVLYLAVAATLLARLLYGLAHAMRIWQTATGAQRLEGVSVRFSTSIGSPVTVGSAVLLPAAAAQWSQQRLRIVLAHERSHIRQGDFYLQILAGVYAAIVWPSPLGWILKRKLYELGEAVGDRAGLEAAASRTSYALLLLELAALPRPTLLGVAMARSSHLSQRIERLLDESRFQNAFARSRRALLAWLVVPAALVAATTLVRVEAATPAQEPAQVSTPAEPQAPAASPEQLPPPPPEGPQGQLPPPPEGAQPGRMPPPPGAPQNGPQNGPGGPGGPNFAQGPQGGFGPHGFGPHGDPYALIEDDKTATQSNFGRPSAPPEIVEKARKQTHSKNFLLFEHEGKSYIVDDPALIAKLEAAQKPLAELGKQLHEADEKQREESRKAMEQAHKQIAEIKVPDLSKQMDEINKALATLKAKQGTTISREQLGDLQRQLADVQRQLGSLQGHPGPMEPFHGQMGQPEPFHGQPGQFHEQGRFGGEMGKLGGEMGKLAQDQEKTTHSVIDESLKNGKAKPVE